MQPQISGQGYRGPDSAATALYYPLKLGQLAMRFALAGHLEKLDSSPQTAIFEQPFHAHLHQLWLQ
jgi:hypothetical protein